MGSLLAPQTDRLDEWPTELRQISFPSRGTQLRPVPQPSALRLRVVDFLTIRLNPTRSLIANTYSDIHSL